MKSYKHIYESRVFNMYELRKIQGLFNLMSTNARDNAKEVVTALDENASENARNRWFARSAKLLSLHSKINVQKSYWRLKEFVAKKSKTSTENRSHQLRKTFGIL